MQAAAATVRVRNGAARSRRMRKQNERGDHERETGGIQRAKTTEFFKNIKESYALEYELKTPDSPPSSSSYISPRRQRANSGGKREDALKITDTRMRPGCIIHPSHAHKLKWDILVGKYHFVLSWYTAFSNIQLVVYRCFHFLQCCEHTLSNMFLSACVWIFGYFGQLHRRFIWCRYVALL